MKINLVEIGNDKGLKLPKVILEEISDKGLSRTKSKRGLYRVETYP